MRAHSPELPNATRVAQASAFEEILPASGEVCWLRLDAGGRIVQASAGCRHTFERDPGALVGEPAVDLFEHLPAFEGREGSFEALARRGSRPCHVRLLWKQEPAGYHVLLVNLERLQGAFAESAVTSRFASVVTHELRNPLSSVKMVVQTMGRAIAGDERAGRRLAIAVREIRTIERILVALSELLRGRQGPVTEVAPAALAADAARGAQIEYDERGLTLWTRVEPDLPALRCDPERTRLALEHLLAETARALREGEVSLSASREAEGVRFLVRPLTPGVPPPGGDVISAAMAERIARDQGGSFAVAQLGDGFAYSLLVPSVAP